MEAYLATLVIVALAIVLGGAVCALGRDGREWDWLAPSIGLAGNSGGVRAVGRQPGLVGGAARQAGFDSMTAEELDEVDLVVAPRTLYASAPPSNLVRVRSTRFYDLYRRTGPTPPRRALAEGVTPGVTLDCADPVVRSLARSGAQAYVRPAPVLGTNVGWLGAGGESLASDPTQLLLNPVRTAEQSLRLPPSRWELSLSYRGSSPLTVGAPGLAVSMPAYLADSSAFWRVGSVVSTGAPVKVSVTTGPRRRFDAIRPAQIFGLAAVRENEPGRLVPFNRACNHYVDWYAPSR